MKVVALREAKQSLSGFVDHAQRQRVLITRHGKPAALVIGVEGYDYEDLLLMSSAHFWQMIEQRRKQPTLPMEAVRRRLGTSPRRRKRRA